MTIAVIGAGGQLGRDLVPLLGDEVVPLLHTDIDITDADSVTERLTPLQVDVVVNCAAYNLVDKAEQEPASAFATNAFGPLHLARWCGARGVTLMHISTDFVFGAATERHHSYSEQDCPGPISVYGMSKLAGEQFVTVCCPQHFVVRTCGLYGQPAPHSKGNFVQTMLRLGRTHDEVRVVADQRCTPTSTLELAQGLVQLLRTNRFGLYHATNTGDTTWAEFASAIFELAGLKTSVTPITSAEFGAAARRPGYSVLSCEKLHSATGHTLRHWREALADYVSSLPLDS